MAANKKFSKDEVVQQLRHVQREIQYPKNRDIDKERSYLNYSLTPRRGMSPKDYLKKRLKEIHVTNRKDRVILSGWIVTKPRELDEKDERAFFEACFEFMAGRYGGKNVISAEVHKDESGEPHLHFLFTPVTSYTENENLVKVIKLMKEHPELNNTEAGAILGVSRKTVARYRNCTEEDIKTEKLNAKEVISKNDLITFHGDLQNFLNKKGINANVNSGVTKAQGGNMTVDQLKMQREHLMTHGQHVDEIISNIDAVIDSVNQEYDEFDF